MQESSLIVCGSITSKKSKKSKTFCLQLHESRLGWPHAHGHSGCTVVCERLKQIAPFLIGTARWVHLNGTMKFAKAQQPVRPVPQGIPKEPLLVVLCIRRSATWTRLGRQKTCSLAMEQASLEGFLGQSVSRSYASKRASDHQQKKGCLSSCRAVTLHGGGYRHGMQWESGLFPDPRYQKTGRGIAAIPIERDPVPTARPSKT